MNDGTQGIDFVTASIDNTVGTITSQPSYLYFERANLSLTPTSGLPGDTIRYSGHGFAAGETVELHANSPAGPLLASKVANGSGALIGNFVVPVPSGAATTEIVAVGLTSGNQGWALLSVGCTDDWASAVSGNWNTAANWSTGSVPSSSDVACIILPGSYPVSMDQSYTVAGLLLGASTGTETLVLDGRGVNFTLNGPSTILSHGVLSMTSVDGNYSLIGGTGTLTNGGALKVLSGGGLGMTSGTLVQSGGTVSVSSAGSRPFRATGERATCGPTSSTPRARTRSSTRTTPGWTAGTRSPTRAR